MTTPKPPARAAGACRAKAPCGEKCCCVATAGHKLHICRRANCDICHSRLRYDFEKKR